MIRSAFHELYKWIENMDLQRKLTIMSSVIIVPFVGIILFLLVMFGRYGDSYDGIVRNVTLVNDYNIRFKEDMDSVMYQMVARSLGSEEVEEAIGMKNPERMIDEAEAGFEQLEQSSTSQQASQVSSHVLKLLGTLRKHVENISSTVKVSGSYEENMVKLDNDIRIITELIQERIAEYLSYETVSMEQVRQNMVASRIGLIRAAVITLLLLIAVAIVFAALIMRSITRPIRQLCDASEQIGKGHFDTRINIAARNELSLLGNSFNHMSEQITVLIEDIRTEQIYNRNMELKLLQSQINPHFLNNTLEIINWEARIAGDERVSAMIEALSTMLDAALDRGGRTQIPLREELGYADAYLYIIRERLGEKLHIGREIDETILDLMVPRLILQPLVENAVEHDITPRHGGSLCIRASCVENRIILEVEHDGSMNAEDLLSIEELLSSPVEDTKVSGQVGLRNVRQRLTLLYGEEGELLLRQCAPDRILARVSFPCS